MGCWGTATWAYLAYRWGLTPCSRLRASLLTATRWSMRGSLICRLGGSLVESLFHRWVWRGLLQNERALQIMNLMEVVIVFVCVGSDLARFKWHYVKLPWSRIYSVVSHNINSTTRNCSVVGMRCSLFCLPPDWLFTLRCYIILSEHSLSMF